MKFLRSFSRIFIGIVFIFSGFVKGVDPLGTAYRIEDYLIAYGWEWALPLALFASVSLCALEFLLGVAMLLNLRLKHLAWPLLLLMVWFTALTFYDAVYEPVPDCGCFGDAVKLTNWETFYKNIVLMVFVGIIFFERKRYKGLLSILGQNVAIILVILGFTWFSLYQYQHLPMVDFRSWKVGADLVPENPGVSKIYLKYRNIDTGEEKEYLSPNYPWNDSVWLSEWEFVDQRVDDSDVVRGHDLAIYDLEGNEYTEFYIENPDYQFLLISYDLEVADQEGLRKAGRLFSDLDNAGFSMITITGSLKDEIKEIGSQIHPDMEFFNGDDIELKTMVRANPGLILLKDGVVIDKWHYNDFPSFDDLNEEYLSN